MLKRIMALALGVFTAFSSVNVTRAADRKGPDLIVTDVRINNNYFHAGDDIRFEIDVKNIGDEVCDSGWIWMREDSGAKRRDAGTDHAQWSKIWLYPGDTMTWSVINYVAVGDELHGQVLCDSAYGVGDVNSGNNTYKYSFKSLATAPNLKISDVNVTPKNFKAGDNVTFKIDLENIGNAEIPYSEIDGEIVMNKKVLPFTTVQALKAGEKVSFEVPSKADSDALLLEAEINFDRTISEINYEDNVFKKDIYSIVEIPYDWDTVRIGGGGYVPRLELHKTDPSVMYLGGDVGGAYRYDFSIEEWIPITEELIFLDKNYTGTHAIELDDNDSNVVYLALGAGVSGTEGVVRRSGVFRSDDRGKTLTDMKLPAAIHYDGRIHSAMTLDPNNSNILYVAAPYDGLFRTKNAGDKVPVWEKLKVPDFKLTSQREKAMDCVAIDKTETINGRSKNIYVSTPSGVYQSSDGGETFVQLPGSPKYVKEMTVNSKGELYAVTDIAGGGLVKFDGVTWRSVAPYPDKIYNSFSINPFDENMIVMSTNNDIYLTDNDGLTWRNARTDAQAEFLTEWEPRGHFAASISFVRFDPNNNKNVYFGDWFGVWRTEDITEKITKWKSVIRGYEEFCVRTIRPAPGKVRLFVGAMDNNGVVCEDIFDFPKIQLQNPNVQESTGIDYSDNRPDIVARVGGDAWGSGPGNAGFSVDGGFTWQPFEDYPINVNNADWRATNGFVCVASDVNEDGKATIIVQPQSDRFYRSTDHGKSWSVVETLPAMLHADFNDFNEPMDADTQNKDIFYAFDRYSGEFLVSRDNGETFSAVNKLAKSDRCNFVVAVPGMEGHVFVAIGGEGLWYTKNYGKTFEKIETAQSARLFTIGKESPNTGLPTLYIFGSVDGVRGIYRSEDFGKTWDKVGTPSDLGDDICTIKADLQDFGVVYMVYQGRGVHLGIPSDLDIKPPRVTVNTKLKDQIIKDKNFVIEGTITEQATVYANINGREYKVETDENNRFVINAVLNEGENEAVFYAVDKMGHRSKEISYTFTHDPKYINVVIDQSNGICMEKSFTMTGMVSVLNDEKAITVNGNRVSVNPKTKRFTYTSAINEGVNELVAEAWDNDGNRVSKTLSIEFDTTPPNINLDRTVSETSDVLYMLRGTVSEPCAITIGDVTKQIQSGDSYDIAIPMQLNPGENVFTIALLDPAGNKGYDEIKVRYNPVEKVPEANDEVIAYSTAVTGEPVIDGTIIDGEWYMNRVVSKIFDGVPEAYGVYGLKSDANYLYVAAKIFDKKVVGGIESDWRTDAVELYFDVNMARASSYDEDDRQIRIALNDKIWGLNTGSKYDVAHSIFDGGYIIEARIPWDALDITYGSGTKFGFDFSANDNNLDENSERDGSYGWVGTARDFADASAFGTAIIE